MSPAVPAVTGETYGRVGAHRHQLGHAVTSLHRPQPPVDVGRWYQRYNARVDAQVSAVRPTGPVRAAAT